MRVVLERVVFERVVYRRVVLGRIMPDRIVCKRVVIGMRWLCVRGLYVVRGCGMNIGATHGRNKLHDG